MYCSSLHVSKERRKILSSVTCSEMQQWREKEKERRRGGINRLNDIKEQCCDSEQLAFPSVDRPSFVVCVRARAHLIETDCLVIVHF